jgi:hypothetical protein
MQMAYLHDFPFLGMICYGLYNFCLLACFQWDLFWSLNIQIWILSYISILFLDAIPMMVIALSNFEWLKVMV